MKSEKGLVEELTTYMIFRDSSEKGDNSKHKKLLEQIQKQRLTLVSSTSAGDKEKLSHLDSFLESFGVTDLTQAIDTLEKQ